MVPIFLSMILFAVANRGRSTPCRTASTLLSPGKADSLNVILKQGTIAGARESAGGTRQFYSFKGIPYAQPPIGQLRFKDPLPPNSWTGIIDGSKDPPLCPQISINETVGEEDCLYLNVFTPSLWTPGLPVMVWIHGGTFYEGGASSISPLPLLTKDIVLVVIQYRLGTLGFLSTEDDVLPGNLGLKDQTLALKWVQQNIHSFGGDPRKVTLAGHSAGSSSVHFQVLSPKAKGLFHRVIMQSGTALASWATRIDHGMVARAISEQFNCTKKENTFSSTDLLQCLQVLPVETLVQIPLKFGLLAGLPAVMTPRVDGDFLPDHPATLLRYGRYNHVSAIIGFTKHEGAKTALGFATNPIIAKAFLNNLDVIGPALFTFDNEKSPSALSRKTYSHYMKNQEITLENVDAAVQMVTDLGFISDIVETMRLHADRDCNIYAYEFEYKGQFGYTDIFGPTVGTHWVAHIDELNYLFNKTDAVLERADDLDMREIMVDLWTNFISTGYTTPDYSLGFKWFPFSKMIPLHLVIDTQPTLQYLNKDEAIAFTRSLDTRRNELLFSR